MKIDVIFFNKEEKVFIKYIVILEKANNIIRSKFGSEFIYGKNYLKP